MRNARSKLTALTLGLLALSTGSARAANIASVVGAPGSGTWNNTCLGPPAPVLPNGTSQLPACGGGAECLHRVVLDTNEFPGATCSDGTPGVFYVRPGSGDDAARWVIHLQGGGMCRDHESCLERWCGQQGNLPYTANKMSSDWNGDGVIDLAPHVRGPGMASANPANEFSTWTHVWAYYCSSDSWQGRESDVSFVGAAGSFDLDARGHTILAAMRKMLRKNNVDTGWTAEGQHLPIADLDAATEIVFTGTSAGAKGAISNADWFLTPFPAARRSLVLDANFDISDNVLWDNDVWIDEDNDGDGDENYYSARIGLVNAGWAPGGYHHAIDAFTDESCRDVYELAGRMDRCSEFSTMLVLNSGAPLIETPTFVRLDLTDPVISDAYTDHPNSEDYSILIGGQFGTPTTMADFAFLARASLLEIYDDHDSVSGVIAPRCSQHVGLEDWATFMLKLTPDTDETFTPPALVVGTDSNVHDALWTWLDVAGGGARVDIRRLDTDQPVPFSTCN